MSLLWVAATLTAAAAQTARNATQTHLTRAIGTLGATLTRLLFSLPFALLFLALIAAATGQVPPTLTLRAQAFTMLGALSQIAATALMRVTMKSQSFAVTTAWIKTEPVLGDPLTWPMLAAFAIATAGVLFISLKPGTAPSLWSDSGPTLTGLLAGALFGASAIGFRGGILALPSGDFLIRATTILVLALTLQAAVLSVWMLMFDRRALAGSFGVWRSSLGRGSWGRSPRSSGS